MSEKTAAFDKAAIFSEAWLKTMEDRARKSNQEDGAPDVVVGYYAARKVKGKWKISNGRAWWNDPVVVREIHEYADGSVCATSYIEGVQLFGRRNIENSGMKAIRPSELRGLLPIAKVAYFDHRHTDKNGRALRITRDLREQKEDAE